MLKAESERFMKSSLHKNEHAAIDRIAELPGSVWAAIEQVIAGEIAAGLYKPGEKLPSENALALRFAVNRHTVRQAMSHLARRGIVRIEHGRGTYVIESAIDYALGKRTRFTKNLAAAGLPAKHRVIGISETAAGPKIAEAFKLRSSDRVTLIVATGEAGDRVLSVGEHFFPPDMPGIGVAVERTGSITRALTEFGIVDYERLHSVITARLPDARTAMLLGQAETRPVLCVEYVNVAPDGRPIEFGRTHFPGDRLQLTVAHGEPHD
jgi:GntR family phosphonate transport system transcriptional regulator